MNTTPVSQVQELEKKYQEIHQRRLELEAEFLRIEKQYKQIVAEIADLKDKTHIQNLHHTIDTLN
jgi:molecular chaperone GrpE (heat shock protein)